MKKELEAMYPVFGLLAIVVLIVIIKILSTGTTFVDETRRPQKQEARP